jgi:hypothetical protein
VSAFWWFVVITVVAVAVFVVVYLLFDDYDSVVSLVTGVVLGFVVPTMWIGLLANHISMNITETKCHQWGDSAQLEVRWVRYNTFSADCFALYNGQWIDKDKIRIVPTGAQP